MLKHIKQPGKKGCAAVVLVCALSALFSCGYRFAGGGTLPMGVKTVCVSLFENKTSEAGLENTLASRLNYEFNRNGVRVTANPEKAEARLTGKIRSVSVTTVSYKGDQTTVESRVTMVVDARLKNKEGVDIWAVDNFSESQTYTAAVDKAAAINNKKAALATLVQRLSENFYSRLTEDF